MENYYSPFIFGAIWILAYLGAKLFNYASNLFDGFSIKNCFNNKNYKIMKNDLYKYKYKKLHDKAFIYYLTLCINNAIELAYDLASKDMKRVAKEKRINQLYDKFFGEKTAV